MKHKHLAALAALTIVLLTIPSNAASGFCHCMYRAGLPGSSSLINTYMNVAGYQSSIIADPSKATLLSKISSAAKILYINTHGAPGSLECAGGVSMYATDITSAGISMAFLQACSSSTYSSTYNGVAQKLSLLGVPRIIGFNATIYVPQANCYSETFFVYLMNGDPLSISSSYALQMTFATYGNYGGTNYVTVFGGAQTMP